MCFVDSVTSHGVGGAIEDWRVDGIWKDISIEIGAKVSSELTKSSFAPVLKAWQS
jgi:hypothetical protein